jgi:hypothetical protein
MNTQAAFETQWEYLLSFLPQDKTLEASAREYGAIIRKRSFEKASDLLRLALVYACCGLSLRQTASWAQMAGVAHVSDVALLKRFRAAPKWLGNVLGEKLAERAKASHQSAPNLRLRIVDATVVSEPGSKGSNWRVHLGFDLNRFAIDHLELTDFRGGETLRRFEAKAGEVFVGDQGYAHCKGMAAIVRSGGDLLIRMNWQNVPLDKPDGTPFDLFEQLRSLDEASPGDFQVIVAPKGKGRKDTFPARLIALRKTEPAAEDARRKVIKERSRKSRNIDPRTFEAAGYVLIITTLPPEAASPKQVLEIYRLRWQVELVFKRLKSILDLKELPAKDPRLIQTYIYAKLIAALLLEEFTEAYLSFSPWGFRLAQPPAESMENPGNPR